MVDRKFIIEDHELVETTVKEEDHFIPFMLDEKGHMVSYKNPYNNPIMLKIEDIVGAMLIFKNSLSKSDRRSLRRYRKELKTKVCYNCSRRWQCYNTNYELNDIEILDIDKCREKAEVIKHFCLVNGSYAYPMKKISKWVKKIIPCRVLLVKERITEILAYYKYGY